MVEETTVFIDSKGTLHQTKNQAIRAELSETVGNFAFAGKIIENRAAISVLLSMIEEENDGN